MSKKLISLSIFGIALALAFVLGVNNAAQAGFFDREPMRVDRDLGTFHMNDVNQFGVDMAFSSPRGTDRDADAQAYIFMPQSYGLGGNYGWNAF